MDDRCRQIDTLLTEAMTRELSPEERRSLDQHCASCPDCAAAYRALLATRELLRSHRPEDDAPPTLLRENLHRRLVEEQARQADKRPAFGLRWKPAFGISVCMLLTILGYFLMPAFPDKSDEGTIISRTTVDAKEPLTIKIAYTADRPLTDVAVTIRLDEGISFYTDDEKLRSLREYTWHGDLRTGINEIPFVVTVERLGTHRIRTEASYDDYRHRHDVELQAEQRTVIVTYLSYKKRPL